MAPSKSKKKAPPPRRSRPAQATTNGNGPSESESETDSNAEQETESIEVVQRNRGGKKNNKKPQPVAAASDDDDVDDAPGPSRRGGGGRGQGGPKNRGRGKSAGNGRGRGQSRGQRNNDSGSGADFIDDDESDSDAEQETETVEVAQRNHGGKKNNKKPQPAAAAASASDHEDDDDDVPGPSRRGGQGQGGPKNRGRGKSAGKGRGRGQSRGRGQRNNDSGSDFIDNDEDESDEEAAEDTADDDVNDAKIKDMVIGVVREIILSNSAKTITTKASIIKNQLDGKRKLFVKIIRDAQEALEEVYGIKVVTIDKDKESRTGFTSNLDNSSTHFFSTSIFPTMSVAIFNEFVNMEVENAEHTLLSAILSIIFMKYLDVGVRGEVLWESVLKKTGLADKLKVKQSDLHRYMKKEYIDNYYLTATLDRDDNDEIFYRYNWGPRAHFEFSKSEILLYTAKLLDVPFFSFHNQLQSISDDMSHEEFDKFLATNMDKQNTQRFSGMFRKPDAADVDNDENEIEELMNV